MEISVKLDDKSDAVTMSMDRFLEINRMAERVAEKHRTEREAWLERDVATRKRADDTRKAAETEVARVRGLMDRDLLRKIIADEVGALKARKEYHAGDIGEILGRIEGRFAKEPLPTVTTSAEWPAWRIIGNPYVGASIGTITDVDEGGRVIPRE